MAKIKLTDLPALLKKLFPDNPEVASLEIEESATPAKPAPAVTSTDPAVAELKTTVDTLLAENGKLLNAITEMKTRSDNQEKLITDKAKTEQAQKVQSAIDTAIKEGRIPAKNDAVIASYKSLLEANFDSASSVIAALPVIAPTNPGNPNTPAPAAPGAGKKSGSPILDVINETGNFVQ